jgi:hypothetical protein
MRLEVFTGMDALSAMAIQRAADQVEAFIKEEIETSEASKVQVSGSITTAQVKGNPVWVFAFTVFVP